MAKRKRLAPLDTLESLENILRRHRLQTEEWIKEAMIANQDPLPRILKRIYGCIPQWYSGIFIPSSKLNGSHGDHPYRHAYPGAIQPKLLEQLRAEHRKSQIMLFSMLREAEERFPETAFVKLIHRFESRGKISMDEIKQETH